MRERTDRRRLGRTPGGRRALRAALALVAVSPLVTVCASAGESVAPAKQSADAGAPFVPRVPRSTRSLPSTNTGRPFSPVGTGRPLAPTGTGRPFVNDSLPRTKLPGTRLTFPPVPGAAFVSPVMPAADDVLDPNVPVDAPPPFEPEPAPAPAEEPAPPAEEPVVPPEYVELVDRLVEEGRRQLENGAMSAAEASFGGAIVYAPRSSDLRLLHALAQIGAGNVDGAAEELHSAIRLRSGALGDALDVERAYGGRDGLEAVVASLDRYLEAYPLKSDARFLGAFLLLKAGDAATARTAVDTLIEHDPKYPHAARLRDEVESTAKVAVRDA